MNVGYVMISFILLDVAANLGFVLLVSIHSTYKFVKKRCSFKKKNKYRITFEEKIGSHKLPHTSEQSVTQTEFSEV